MPKENHERQRWLTSSPLQLYKREVVHYGLLRVHFNHCSRHWLHCCHKKEITALLPTCAVKSPNMWRSSRPTVVLLFCTSIIADTTRFFKIFQRWFWKMAVLTPTRTLIHNEKEYSASHTEYSSNIKTMVGTTRFELAASSPKHVERLWVQFQTIETLHIDNFF